MPDKMQDLDKPSATATMLVQALATIAVAIDRAAHVLGVAATEQQTAVSTQRRSSAKLAAATIESLLITARGHDRLELTADDHRNLTIAAVLLRKL